MAIASTDPSFLLIYGLDESGNLATRRNSGALGSAQDLSIYQSSGTDGIPAVNDGNGGKAAWFDVSYPSPSTLASATRALRGATAVGSAHAARPIIPVTSAANDFAFGARFKWIGGETNGPAANERQFIFGLASTSNSLIDWAISILPDVAANPAAGAQLDVRVGQATFVITGALWTATGSPATYYILPDEWYRVVVRVYNTDATHWLFKVYLYRESTGTTYTFTYNTTNFTSASDYSAAMDSEATTRVQISYDGGGSSNPVAFYGYIDECWLYDAPMSDGDASTTVSGGLSIPWTEPNYSQLDHAVYVAVAKEGASFPVPRALPVGGLKARHPVNVRGRRLKVRYEAFRAGRPWALRKSEFIFDSSGPRPGRDGVPAGLLKFASGFIRRPGALPADCVVDGRNVNLAFDVPRSRKGFKIRRDVATADAANAFCAYRDLSDGLFQLYKVGGDLYVETGTSAVLLDSGYSTTHLPSFGILNGRVVILTPGRQKTHRSSYSAVESFGITVGSAPTLSLIAGSLTGTYNYAYTEYDSVTGDESEPVFATAAVSPAGQGVRVTMPAVHSDARFSKRRIYRTTSGGANTTALLLATITSATTYDDLTGSDGVTAIAQVGGSYITGTPPDTFSKVTIHRERAFYYGGTTYSNRVYWTEAGTLQRFYASAYVEAEGPVRCVIAQGQRLIIFTDYTVEILESDFVRNSADGSYILQRTVVSRTVGCFGHLAAVNAHGRVFWIDSRGVWTLNGDDPTPISENIRGLFPFINTNLKHRVVASYNHITRQIWFVVALGGEEFQTDTSRTQTILPYNLDKNNWSVPYSLEASFAGQFDDDLNGLQFGIMDQIGVFKQMETYEGDGIDGSETFTFEGTINGAISSNVITPLVAPTGWTTDSLRGMGVTLRDPVTGLKFSTLVASNTTTNFTLKESAPAGFGDADLFYIGGINSYVEPAEQDFGTENDKVARFLSSEFDDISTARII